MTSKQIELVKEASLVLMDYIEADDEDQRDNARMNWACGVLTTFRKDEHDDISEEFNKGVTDFLTAATDD